MSDLISRDALLADFERYKANRHPLNNGLTLIDDCIANIKNFPRPSLPPRPVRKALGLETTEEE